jgi:phosphopantothenoylcysteine decarboxylase/phosphopantothenate--cysteine ligase
MACGEYGEGKMTEPSQIITYLINFFTINKIASKTKLKALVTAGPTKEYIDPVRFISNQSSGKQGYEIARSLAKRGIDTTLISGPTNLDTPENVNIIRVETANEMFVETKKNCRPILQYAQLQFQILKLQIFIITKSKRKIK